MRASELPTAGRAATTTAGLAPPGLVLGRYRLLRRLGAGGFGTVWEAHDERLQREVALKMLPRERIAGGRFEREARAGARLAHPGIVTLYEAAVDDQGAYLVSELVRGETLGQLLEAGRCSDRRIVVLGAALCEALAHAHANGVVHRDVKPSNVLVPDAPVTPAHAVKLTDFGVARLIGGDTLTRAGDVIGTLAYMAPEQAEGLPTGAAADVYSLALVLYEALTGVNPVGTGTAAQRARRLGAHLPPLRRQRRDLPRELGQGIDLALRPRPRERGSIEELRAVMRFALPLLEDKPGVVTSSWPARSSEAVDPAFGEERASHDPGAERTRRFAVRRGGAPAAAGSLDSAEARTPRTSRRARAAAAGAAASSAGWLSVHALAAPAAPAMMALLAGLSVAVAPRLGWLLVTTVSAALLVLGGQPGAALLVLVAALTPALLLPKRGTSWPLAAGAPLLGILGLAGGWPALAARAGTAWRRAVLGFTGPLWLVVAGDLGGRGLYARIPPGVPQRSVWSSSLYDTVHHLLATPATGRLLLVGAVWGIGAALLPAMRSSRSAALDAVAVITWCALLAAATITILGATRDGESLMATHELVVGALANLVIAIVPRVVSSMRGDRKCDDAQA